MAINLVIVEDDPEIRDWITGVCQAAKGITIQNTFADAESFIGQFDEIEADVILMDIHLPGMSGIECVKSLKSKNPHLQFLMFTVFEDDNNVFNSLCVGASGYLLKTATGKELISAILDIHSGGSPMTATIARKVISAFHSPDTNLNEYNKLSKREQELLELLAKGYRYKEIADLLFISIDTVRTHVRNIYEKLQVQSRTEALNRVFPRK